MCIYLKDNFYEINSQAGSDPPKIQKINEEYVKKGNFSEVVGDYLKKNKFPLVQNGLDLSCKYFDVKKRTLRTSRRKK